MPKFDITVFNPVNMEERVLEYDNELSTLIWKASGETVLTDFDIADQPDIGQVKIPLGKKPNTIKIQLGLECNFSCDYCNQRFVPHAPTHNQQDIQPFVDNMSNWFNGGFDGLGEGARFEFWGGEPLVYWKTLKPLAEAIHAKYPHAGLVMITNGSILTEEMTRWIMAMNFSIGLSHDGPGQHVRGPDPLQDPQSKEMILKLYEMLAPRNKFTFNVMINRQNISRAECQEFFEKLIGEELGEDMLDFLVIGEGTFIDAYDEGGLFNSLDGIKQEILYRGYAYKELRENPPKRFSIIHKKVTEFINSIRFGLLSRGMGQKCGMDAPDSIAVDLDGNVLTCQNVSINAVNPAGKSHKIGHVDDLDSVVIDTATHWSDREECPNCPVLHICRGACMFLSGPLWEASCNNAYSDNVVMFAAAIEQMTGMIPRYIEGPLREERKDIFWWVYGEPENPRPMKNWADKKVIPIKAV